MKNTLFPICFILVLLIPVTGSTQSPAKWNVNGNTASANDFLGTTNNQPVIFFTNNTERMRLKSTGELRINSLSGSGNSFVMANSFGDLQRIAFPNDSNKVLTGAGTFRSISSYNIWQQNGNSVFLPSGNVGIGISTPQYKLDVNGNAHFSGMLYANGITLLNKMEADTIKGADMMEVNNNLELSGGAINEIYTKTGDLRLQSYAGNNGNLFLAAGTTGNVGVGTFTPQYKLDVSGNARVTGKLYAYRIVGTLGDSLIRFGDSTVVINYNTGRIFNNSSTAGFGLGQSAFGTGARSTAIGYRVVSGTAAVNSVTIGTGVTNGPLFTNVVPNSMAVAFNSTVPTLFVAGANGVGTIGKVGIGTSSPQADFQVGNGVQKVTAGSSYGIVGTNGNTFSNAYLGFNVARTGSGQWSTENDGGGNGGVVLLGDMGGGLRVIGLPSTGATNQNVNDQFIADHTKLYVRNDGRVVIGSETMVSGPRDVLTTLLTVDGTVVCRELFVTQNNWADSILSPEYSLMTFDSLESYLNVNKHLPGVPTEEEIKLNGSNLGQTDVILLAKIEELTLYMLQLQKQNAVMQKQIEELKQK